MYLQPAAAQKITTNVANPAPKEHSLYLFPYSSTNSPLEQRPHLGDIIDALALEILSQVLLVGIQQLQMEGLKPSVHFLLGCPPQSCCLWKQ